MNIIVVGCGKVGYTLVEQLSKESHNIVVIDNKEEKINEVTNNLDVMGFVGNGVSYETLLSAGINTADLLIAVTGSDEQNLLTCVIAKKASNCKTIARVRNPIYNSEINFLRDELGLTAVINPELASATEIARVFQFPSAVRIDSFSKGRFELLHFKIPQGNVLDGKKLSEIRSALKTGILICTVRRGEDVIIPKGDFVLCQGDSLSVAATPSAATDFFNKIGMKAGAVTNSMIVGGGNIAIYLANRLLEAGIAVKIIEQDSKRADHLSEVLPKATIICGDGTDEKLLLQEGLEHVDGFASLTGLDEENILLSLYAKKIAPKAKVMTKINRTNFVSVLDDIELDSITRPRLITADAISRIARSMNASLNSNVENLYSLEDDRAEALEFYIKEASKITNVPLSELKIKKNVLICSINRGKEIIIPKGSDRIQVGDSVVVVSTLDGMDEIQDICEE